jgi:predicted RNA-binding Zn-ribbon protein involved in translation (DUF1610 family)
MVEEYINKNNLLAEIRRAASRSSLGETTEPYLDWKDVVSFIVEAPIVEADIDELKKELEDLRNRLHLIWAIGFDYDGCGTVKSLKELIDELVSYTKLPREYVPDITSRTGRWVQSEEWAEDFTCSLCGNTAFKDDHGNYNVRTKYCPHCGAKMIKED